MTRPPDFIEQSFVRFPSVFTRLTGRNGVVREYQALVAPTAEFCIIPTADAYTLGYPEVAPSDPRIPLPNSKMFASYTGYGRGTVINVPRVEVGSISFSNVDFLAFDILQAAGFDLVLGRNLLRSTHLEQDFASGLFRLEKVADSQ